jgi:hypothetical protein
MKMVVARRAGQESHHGALLHYDRFNQFDGRCVYSINVEEANKQQRTRLDMFC